MSEEKLNITICAGTACYLMGGGDLLALEWPADLAERIAVTGAPCLGGCREPESRPPFARVGGVLYERLTQDALVSVVRRELERGGRHESGE